MVPAAFVELEALPLTTHGKLDHKALPAPSFSGDLQQRVEPSTDLELKLHALWAEVLGHGEFGVSDNFFLVGGYSLAAARLVSRIEENLGQRLPLASLFQSPTLADLASRLNDGEILDHRRFRSLVMVQGHVTGADGRDEKPRHCQESALMGAWCHGMPPSILEGHANGPVSQTRKAFSSPRSSGQRERARVRSRSTGSGWSS